jgi:hypothetical protein
MWNKPYWTVTEANLPKTHTHREAHIQKHTYRSTHTEAHIQKHTHTEAHTQKHTYRSTHTEAHIHIMHQSLHSSS